MFVNVCNMRIVILMDCSLQSSLWYVLSLYRDGTVDRDRTQELIGTIS